jgi:hypothetical protein
LPQCKFFLPHRELKTRIGQTGANITEDTILRCSRTLDPLIQLNHRFATSTGSSSSREGGGGHSKAKIGKDLQITVRALVDSEVFVNKNRRLHPIHGKYKPLFGSLDSKSYRKWLSEATNFPVDI